MSIDELTSIEEEFTRHLQTIRDLSKKLTKSHVLRIGAWLKKLCSVVDNFFWRKNRNLYAEVLALMLQYGELSSPFDKAPPEGSLPKLTIYEIPFSIREKLEAYRIKQEDQQKNNQSHLSLNQKNFDSNNLRLKKRHSIALNCFKSIADDVSLHENLDCQNMSILANLETLRKTQKTSKLRQLSKFKSANPHNPNNPNPYNPTPKNQLLLQTIQQVLIFLAKNSKDLQDDPNYAHLLEQLVQFGTENGKDFQNLKFSLIHQ